MCAVTTADTFRVRSLFSEKFFWIAIVSGAIIYLPSLVWTLGHDQQLFAETGSLLIQHKQLYSEIWDIKPPNIHYVYAIAQLVFTRSEFAIRFADYLSFLVSLVLIYANVEKTFRAKELKHHFALIASLVFAT